MYVDIVISNDFNLNKKYYFLFFKSAIRMGTRTQVLIRPPLPTTIALPNPWNAIVMKTLNGS